MGRLETGETTTFGVLLDLEEGRMSIYQGGQRLGMIKAGLSGRYCWFVNLWGQSRSEQEVRIQGGSPPV